MDLDDVGKQIELQDTDGKITKSTIMMGIKTPEGKIFLFDQNYISPDTQCEAIRTFMEQHRRTDDNSR